MTITTDELYKALENKFGKPEAKELLAYIKDDIQARSLKEYPKPIERIITWGIRHCVLMRNLALAISLIYLPLIPILPHSLWMVVIPLSALPILSAALFFWYQESKRELRKYRKERFITVS